MAEIKSIESLFKKGSKVGWSNLDRSILPAQMYDLDGNEIVFGKGFSRGARVPKVFTREILVGDLIPGSSWGSSLANLLTKSAWDSLRFPVIEKNSGVCEFCGEYVGRSLEIHEVWSYSDLANEDDLSGLDDEKLFFGKQTLDGLVGVCSRCHQCFHYGLADLNGYGQAVKKRLAVINGWSSEQTDEYIDVLFQRHEILNRQHWRLDLSLLANTSEDGGLLVSRSWSRDEESRQVLWKENSYGTSLTIITNCRWRLTNEKEWSFLAA